MRLRSGNDDRLANGRGAAALAVTLLLCGLCPAHALSIGQVIDFSDMSPEIFELNAVKNFERLDKDKDGYISVAEEPASKRYDTKSGYIIEASAKAGEWIARRDKNLDGKVDLKEFSSALLRMKSKN